MVIKKNNEILASSGRMNIVAAKFCTKPENFSKDVTIIKQHLNGLRTGLATDGRKGTLLTSPQHCPLQLSAHPLLMSYLIKRKSLLSAAIKADGQRFCRRYGNMGKDVNWTNKKERAAFQRLAQDDMQNLSPPALVKAARTKAVEVHLHRSVAAARGGDADGQEWPGMNQAPLPVLI